MSPGLRLEVVVGRQHGVTATLVPGATIVLGRALDGDIVLREPSLAARAILLRVAGDGERVSIEALAEGVCVGEDTLAVGEGITLGAGATLAIGSLVLGIVAAGAGSDPGIDAGTDADAGDFADALDWEAAMGLSDVTDAADLPEGSGVPGTANGADAASAIDAALATRADAGLDTGSPTGLDGAPGPLARGSSGPFANAAGAAGFAAAAAGQPADDVADHAAGDPAAPDVPAVAARPKRRSLVSLGSMTVFACVALAGWLWYSGDGVAEGPTLAARLEGSFPGLALERRTGGAHVVRGFVPARADAIRLERWLGAQPERPSSAVLVDTDLAERVEDVFRINGVEASVRSLVAGAAVVDTRVADPDELVRLETRVGADVPQLLSLTLENTPPVPPEEPARNDPGKRVELVVATDPAYVVTRDRSRYFVGALLPSGHRIAGIDEGVVHLVKNDVATELKF